MPHAEDHSLMWVANQMPRKSRSPDRPKVLAWALADAYADKAAFELWRDIQTHAALIGRTDWGIDPSEEEFAAHLKVISPELFSLIEGTIPQHCDIEFSAIRRFWLTMKVGDMKTPKFTMRSFCRDCARADRPKAN
jgi:hypothetical protein